MTHEEALKELNDMRDCAVSRGSYYGENAVEIYDIAISALEKQIPKKCADIQKPVIKWGICPNCNGIPFKLDRPRRIFEDEKFCSNCGQAIDWSENDE